MKQNTSIENCNIRKQILRQSQCSVWATTDRSSGKILRKDKDSLCLTHLQVYVVVDVSWQCLQHLVVAAQESEHGQSAQVVRVRGVAEGVDHVDKYGRAVRSVLLSLQVILSVCRVTRVMCLTCNIQLRDSNVEHK